MSDDQKPPAPELPQLDYSALQRPHAKKRLALPIATQPLMPPTAPAQTPPPPALRAPLTVAPEGGVEEAVRSVAEPAPASKKDEGPPNALGELAIMGETYLTDQLSGQTSEPEKPPVRITTPLSPTQRADPTPPPSAPRSLAEQLRAVTLQSTDAEVTDSIHPSTPPESQVPPGPDTSDNNVEEVLEAEGVEGSGSNPPNPPLVQIPDNALIVPNPAPHSTTLLSGSAEVPPAEPAISSGMKAEMVIRPIFCTNCGEKLEDLTKPCTNCGRMPQSVRSYTTPVPGAPPSRAATKPGPAPAASPVNTDVNRADTLLDQRPPGDRISPPPAAATPISPETAKPAAATSQTVDTTTIVRKTPTEPPPLPPGKAATTPATNTVHTPATDPSPTEPAPAGLTTPYGTPATDVASMPEPPPATGPWSDPPPATSFRPDPVGPDTRRSSDADDTWAKRRSSIDAKVVDPDQMTPMHWAILAASALAALIIIFS